MTAIHRRKTYETSPPTGFQIIDFADGDVALPEGEYFRAISFGVDGNIRVQTLDNTDETILVGSLAPTVQHGCIIKRIYQTGTTATGIIGWF